MSSEEVEVVGCVRWKHYLHVGSLQDVLVVVSRTVSRDVVILVAKLQITLSSARTVLGTSTIVTVRQEENKTVLHVPFGLSGTNELIDNNLSTVGEVTKLSLPHGEGVGMSLGITQLVAEHGELRQVRVGGDELSSLTLSVTSNGGVYWVVVTVLVLVEDVSMSMGESTSFDILTRDSNVVTVLNESGASQSLGSTPIDSLASLERLYTLFEDLSHVLVEAHLLGKGRDGDTNITNSIDRDTRSLGLIRIKHLDFVPLFGNPILSLVLGRLRIIISIL